MEPKTVNLTHFCLNQIIVNLDQIQVQTTSESDHVVKYIDSQIPHVLYNQFVSKYHQYKDDDKVTNWLNKYTVLRCLSFGYSILNEEDVPFLDINFDDDEDKMVLSKMMELHGKRFRNLQRIQFR